MLNKWKLIKYDWFGGYILINKNDSESFLHISLQYKCAEMQHSETNESADVGLLLLFFLSILLL